ncbi:MAG: class I SAM-dependent methyltransferase [Alphaproteobacteria bacterium]|jgi:SAM-dependent methyltransferase|nr:class I SAM-dependent methyltransferase [Alphaproteobacteria bacterium]
MSVDVARLTKPLDQDTYTLLRSGVQDDPAVSVYINEQGDFAVLDPMPVMDYAAYERRSEKLGLQAYAKNSGGLEARLDKVRNLIPEGGRVLEIGAANAAFLELAHDAVPASRYAAIEPDQNTKPDRDRLSWLTQYDGIEEARGSGERFDLIMLFHVFEHIPEPDTFLAEARGLLAEGGALLIEVPCLHDPLLTLYESADYQAFYFQRQHPFVYSAPSLERVLRHNGFAVRTSIPHQRYGIENHLQWLSAGKPGGNARFRELFGVTDVAYRAALEAQGTADTIIVAAVAG